MGDIPADLPTTDGYKYFKYLDSLRPVDDGCDKDRCDVYTAVCEEQLGAGWKTASWASAFRTMPSTALSHWAFALASVAGRMP